MGKPDPEEIRRLIREECRRTGSGTWRVVEDIVDATYDRLVDRWAARRVACDPDDWFAYARIVCRNMIHSTPRADLSRLRTSSLENLDALDEHVRLRRASPPPQLCEQSLAAAKLTAAERVAVDAARECSTIAFAAVAASMTRRDLRVRLRRAAEKIQRVLAARSSPLITHDSESDVPTTRTGTREFAIERVPLSSIDQH